MSASSEHQLRPSSFSSQDTLETHTLKVSKMTWTLVFRLPSVASSIEERLKVGDFKVFKVAGEHNPADLLTKALPREKMYQHLETMGLCHTEGRAASAPQLSF